MVTLRSGTSTKEEVDSDGKPLQNGFHDKIETKSTKRNMEIYVFVSLVLDLLGFTVILPLFPALLDYYSKNDSSGLYNGILGYVSTFQDYLGVPSQFNSVLFGGLLGSLFSLLQFFSSPIIGALSDVYGRKIITIFTLIGIAFSYSLWAVAFNFSIFVFARIVGGLSKGNISMAYTIMTDISDEKNRAKGMALVGIAFSIGFIIGPAIGAGFSKWGSTGWFATSAIYALILSLLNLVYFSIYFEETLPKEKREKALGTRVSTGLDYINPVSLFLFRSVNGLEKEEKTQLRKLGLVYFLYIFFYSGLEFTLTFVTHYQHNYSSMDQGRMFTFLGITMALVQGGYVRRIKSGMEKTMSIMGIIVLIPSFIIIGLSKTSLSLYIGLTLYSLGSSIMVPCLTAYASKKGPDSQKGTILGIWRSLGAFARALGPTVASAGFWILGASKCYTLIALLLLIPLILLRYC